MTCLALTSVGSPAADPDRPVSGLDASLADPKVRAILDDLAPGLRPVKPHHPPFTEIPEAGRGLHRLQGARERWRASRQTPQSVLERDRSRTQHDGLPSAGALQLARENFPALFSAADRRLVPLGPGEEVERYTGLTTAVIDSPDGASLVDSTLPLRARDESGSLQPVDFDLEPTATGWEPANTEVPIEFGETSNDAISFGGDFVVAPGGADVPGTRTSNEIFFPNVAADTDAWVGPTATGARITFQLRSSESPEEVRLSIAGEPGISARVVGDRGSQGFELRRHGELVGTVSPPLAFDADAQPIEVTVRVDGADLVFEVLHQGKDLLYPLVVDPIVENQDSWKYGNSNTAGWQYSESQAAFDAFFGDIGVGNGFHIERRANQWYPGGASGEWQYPALNDYTYIHRADFIHPTHSADATTHRLGMWSTYWDGFQHSWATADSYNYADQHVSICADGQATAPACDEDVNLDQSHGNYVMSSLSTNFGGSWPNVAWNYFGGARVYMSDQNLPDVWYWFEPALGWHHDTPAGPYNGVNESHVRIGDAGVGMWGLWMDVPGRSRQYSTDWGGCSGAHSSRCPVSRAHDFSYAGMSEGRQTVTATGQDVLGKTASQQRVVRIDRTPPALDFRGSTLHQGGETLTSPTYDLRIKATDGSAASDAQNRTGVRSIEVFVRRDTDALFDPLDKDKDGRLQNQPFTRVHSAGPQGCDADHGSCSLETTWRVRRADYEDQPGEYTVRVVAKDQLADSVPAHQATAHTAVKEFTMIVPPPVEERDDDRLGLEKWWTYETTDTGDGTAAHVNVSNGNLVWHSEPIFNLGRGLSTLVNLTYNSQQRVQVPLLETPVEQLMTPYNEVGRGFSMGISSLTRLNERLNVDLAGAGRITLTDPDGTRHVFRAESTGSDVFTPPPGVQVHLRRFSRTQGFINAPVFGYESLEQPSKAWAATRPDGVTHYFDQLGYQTSVEDRNGNVIRFNYDYRSPTRDACLALNQPTNLNVFFLPGKVCAKKVVSVTDPGGRNLTIAYEPRPLAGLPAELIPVGGLPPALQGQTVETAAYASGRVKTITDHDGRVLELAYDADGYLTSMTRARGTSAQQKFRFVYEPVEPPLSIRPLTAILDPRTPTEDPATAIKTRFEYEPRASSDSLTELLLFDREVIAVQDRDASSGALRDVYEVNQATGQTTLTDTRNAVTRYRLDARGRMIELTDARSTVTTVGWDGDNNPTRIAEAVGTAEEAVTDLAYNQNGLVTQHKDPQAQVDSTRGSTELTYANSSGHASHQSLRTTGSPAVPIDANRGFVSDVTSIERPRGNTATFVYDVAGRGNLELRRDHDGHEARTEYGQFGVVTREIDEVDQPTTYADHDPSGLPRTVTDARGGVWSLCYDPLGNVTRATDPRGRSGHHCGDAPAPYRTALTYDALDRLTEQVTPKRSLEEGSYTDRDFQYDENGNLISSKDGNDQWTNREYTAMDQLQEVEPPETDHLGDGAGPISATTRFEYDSEQNLVKEVTPKGEQTPAAGDFETDIRYDEVGRPVASIQRSADPSQEPSLGTGFAYDRRGNLVGLADPMHTKAAPGEPEVDVLSEANRRFSFEYDLVGNRTAEVEDPGDLALRTEFDHDANDNLLSETDPRGKTTTYAYDGQDRLMDVTDPTGARTHYELRPNGQLASVTSPRGTASPDPSDFRTVFEYNENNELVARWLPRHPDDYGGLGREVRYELNAVGDPVTITDGRDNEFDNEFLDTGELRFTERPSWWIYDPSGEMGPFRERPLDQPRDPGGSELPRSEGHGDFGSVAPEPLPGLLPLAGDTTFKYDDERRLTKVIDTWADPTHLEYDAMGRLLRLAQPHDVGGGEGEFIEHTYRYDRNSNQVRITDPEGHVSDLGYDQYDRLVDMQTPGGFANDGRTEDHDFSYDPNGSLTRYRTPRELPWLYEYDAVDRMTSSTNPAEDRTEYTYDSAGNRATEKTPRGHIWAMEYTDRNELAKITAPEAGQHSPAGRETLFSYDRDGNRTLIDEPGAGNRVKTRMVYDGRGMPWKRTTGQTDQMASGGNQRTTITEYDTNGNLRRVINPVGVDGDTQVERRPWSGGALTTSSTAGENATIYRYNEDDLLTAIHLPFGDPDGSGPAGDDQTRWRQDFKRNARGRVEWIDAPYVWEGTCNSDGDGPAADPNCTARTRYEHFDSGWVRSQSEPAVVDPDSGTQGQLAVNYQYDLRGNQTRWATVPGSEQRRIVTRRFFPNGTLRARTAQERGSDPAPQRTYTYQYNAHPSLTKIEERLAGTAPEAPADDWTEIGRDSVERVTEVDNPSALNKRDSLYVYDRDGNVIDRRVDGMLGGGDTYSFRYDAVGRETHTFFNDQWQATADPDRGAGPPAETTTTSYWDSGAMRSRTHHNGVVESRSYDDDGDLLRMRRTKGSAGAVLKDQTYAYDLNGNRTRDERGTHVFNARRQLISWTRAQGPQAGTTVDYTLNGSGAILSETDAGATLHYCLAGDRLKSAWDGGGCGLGQRAGRYLYDGDGFGNLTRIEQPGRDTVYDYDSFGRLTRSDGPSAGGDETTYSYDPFDRRDQRTQSGRTWTYSYVGLSERVSREVSNDEQMRRYAYDSQLQPLGRRTSVTGVDPDYRVFALDANGSIEGIEDEDGDIKTCDGSSDPGCRSDAYRYDPYGQLESGEAGLSSEAADNSLRFEGFQYDVGSETYDMQARPYRPDIGRFLTPDRFEAAAGDLALQTDPMTNSRYVFAAANPVNNIEFDGHIGTTGGPQSRNTQLYGGDPYDRQAGRVTSGPREGSGPGGSSGTPWRPTESQRVGPGPVSRTGRTEIVQPVPGRAGLPPNARPTIITSPDTGGPCDTGIIAHLCQMYEQHQAAQDAMSPTGPPDRSAQGIALEALTLFGPIKAWRVWRRLSELRAATRARTGADNIANGPRLAADLTKREAAAVFDDAGRLHPDVITNSQRIIEGRSLGNPAVIKELTRDGSNIADWAKYTTQSFRSPSGPFQVHFYRNRSTGAVNYNVDFKAVFNRR